MISALRKSAEMMFIRFEVHNSYATVEYVRNSIVERIQL